MEHTVQQIEIDSGVAVGVDGSTSSLRALDIAGKEASCRHETLHVVRAWGLRTAPRPPDTPPGTVPSTEQYQETTEQDTKRIVREQLGEDIGVPVRFHVVHSPAPQALLTASRGASLLVVGHRGRGGFGGLMLGSVAEQCVRHAACPVLVVRPNY